MASRSVASSPAIERTSGSAAGERAPRYNSARSTDSAREGSHDWKTKAADYWMIALAVVAGVGPIVLFAWDSRPTFVPMTCPLGSRWRGSMLSLLSSHSTAAWSPVVPPPDSRE